MMRGSLKSPSLASRPRSRSLLKALGLGVGLGLLLALHATVARAAVDQPASGPAAVQTALLSQAKGAGLLYASYWDAMMRRNWSGSSDCVTQLGHGCNLDDLQDLVDELRGQDTSTKLAEINDFVNRIRYREDQRVYGKKDYWATPEEFFNRGGDCEDFAIAKYMALKALGVPTEAMRLLVLQDVKRGRPHAVLLVEYQGRKLILDNQEEDVLTLGALPHYRVRYSLNESTILRHVAQK